MEKGEMVSENKSINGTRNYVLGRVKLIGRSLSTKR